MESSPRINGATRNLANNKAPLNWTRQRFLTGDVGAWRKFNYGEPLDFVIDIKGR